MDPVALNPSVSISSFQVVSMAKQTLSVLQSPADPEEAFTAALLHRSPPASAFDYHWRVTVAAGKEEEEAVRKGLNKVVVAGGNAAATGEEQGEEAGSSQCRDRTIWR